MIESTENTTDWLSLQLYNNSLTEGLNKYHLPLINKFSE
jgi:hypothetical protein